MDNLVNETNTRLNEIIENLATIKSEYEKKLLENTRSIGSELKKVEKYKKDFYSAKEKIEKMNSDIEGFEEDYQHLVERFKDDELANILIAANKEISAKIEERKVKILKDKKAMNELVSKAENEKKKLVKLNAEKKSLELCLDKITDSYEFYGKAIQEIIDYANDNKDDLCKKALDDDYEATETYENVEIPEEEVITPEEEEIINSKDENIVEEEVVVPEEETEEVEEEIEIEDAPTEEVDTDDENLDDEEKADKKAIEAAFDFGDNFDLENLLNIDDSIDN